MMPSTDLHKFSDVIFGITQKLPLCALGYQPPPSETPPPLDKAPLNLQTVQAPLFRQSPYILVFRGPPPPKTQIFQ